MSNSTSVSGRRRGALGLAALLASALLASGCPATPTPPIELPPPATVVSFSASPTEASEGETITLSWEVEDTTSVAIHRLSGDEVAVDEPGRSRGTTTVEVTGSTTFVLTARGEGGSDSAAARVVVPETVESLFFGAFPPAVEAGEEVTLAWQVAAGPVTVTDGDGAEVHTSAKAFGALVVRPQQSTTYTLTAGARTASVSVSVSPRIHAFASDLAAAAPGAQVTLSWSVGGASTAVLSAEGRGALVTVTDPAQLADGTFEDTLPAGLVEENGYVKYTLVAEAAGAQVTRSVTVWSGTDPKVESFVVPTYALEGSQFSVRWKVQLANRVEVSVDDEVVFVATTPQQVADHTLLLPTPAQAITVTLRAWNERGGVATRSEQTEPVGVPQVVNFEPVPPTVPVGGDPVTLTWNVPNARNLRLSVKDRYELHTVTGPSAETGSITVYPSGPTDYLLEADNTVGNAVLPQTVTASATVPATLTFSPALGPYGGSIGLVGASIAGPLQAFDFAVKNNPGDAFEDISEDGTPTGHPVSTTYTMQVVDLEETFTFPLYDRVLSTSQIAVNNRGWFSLDYAAAHVSTTPVSNWASQLLPPLSFAPYWELLQKDASAEIYWRLDGVGADRRLIVQWNNVRYSSTTTKRMTFQAQLYASGKVVFAYPQVYARTAAADTPSIGIVAPDALAAVGPRLHQLDGDERPVSGDVFTFFSTVPSGYDVGGYAERYTVLVQVPGGGVAEVEGTPGVLFPGTFWISEVNPIPDATAPSGEWFEVTNATDTAYDLSGWELSFGSGLVHTIPAGANLILPPQGVLLFAQSADQALNGGLTPDYVYGGGFPLPDGGGTLTLGLGGDPYDTATWGAGSGQAAGVSVRFDPVLFRHLFLPGVNQSTCAGTGTYGTQTGTPGTRVPSCFPYRYEQLPQGGFEPLAANGGIHLNGSQTQDFIVTLRTDDLTLPAPIRWGAGSYNTLTVSDNGYIALRDVPNEPVFACTVTNCHSANKTSFTSTAPTRLVAPFWDSLSVAPSPSGIYFKRVDPDSAVAGDEYSIVSWEHMRYTTTIAYDLNFQVKFFDSGDIEYHYGTMNGTSATIVRGSSAATWLESPQGGTALVHNITTTFGDGVDPDSAVRFRFVP